MKKYIFFFIIFILHLNSYSQGVDLGDKFSPVASKFKLIGITSKDNSKIYRYTDVFPTTVFTYNVDEFEIKVLNDIVVSLHFVLNPVDNNISVPQSLIKNIEQKSNCQPLKKGGKFYFDDVSSKTIVFRKEMSEYGGDKIHIAVISTTYLSM